MQKKVNILGIPIDVITKDELLSDIFHEQVKQRHIITVNPEMILAAQQDEEFKKILQEAHINTADGTGILWAANTENDSVLISILKLIALLFKKPKNPIPELIKGSDLTLDIMKIAKEKGTRIFLLGAQPNVAELTKNELEKQYHGIQIVGTHAGTPSQYEEERIKDIINDTEPDMLLVAYGAPAQEKWITRNLHKMPTVKTAIGVGGTFDYISKSIRRAPEWLQQLGLEWLYRLMQEPKRWRRIVNAVVIFPYRILQNK